jgi:hypothetical protein
MPTSFHREPAGQKYFPRNTSSPSPSGKITSSDSRKTTKAGEFCKQFRRPMAGISFANAKTNPADRKINGRFASRATRSDEAGTKADANNPKQNERTFPLLPIFLKRKENLAHKANEHRGFFHGFTGWEAVGFYFLNWFEP